MNIVNNDIILKFNSMEFYKLHNVKCGDLLHYNIDYNYINESIFRGLLRILSSLLTTGISIKQYGNGNILFLCSNWFKDRKDIRKWYQSVASLSNSKVIVEPRNKKLCLKNIGRIWIIIKWYIQSRKLHISIKERIYYLSLLFYTASEFWDIQERIKKEKIKFKLLITVCDVVNTEYLAVQWYNNLKIDTASLQHGLISCSVNQWMITASKSKYYLVYGQYTVEQAMKLGKKREKLIEVGMPQHLNSVFSQKLKLQFNNTFGVVLNSEVFHEDNINIIKLANKFSETTKMNYIIKLHPSLKVEMYEEWLNNIKINKVYSTEIDILTFGEKVDFLLIGSSTVFMEYCLNMIPTFMCISNTNHDLYEGIDWCKFHNYDELMDLYIMFSERLSEYEEKYIKTREYLCKYNDIKNEYISFFRKYE